MNINNKYKLREGEACSVKLSGSWNNWEEKNMIQFEKFRFLIKMYFNYLISYRKKFIYIIKLPYGYYEFKFKIDGNWHEIREKTSSVETNPYGTMNYCINCFDFPLYFFYTKLIKNFNIKYQKYNNCQRRN